MSTCQSARRFQQSLHRAVGGTVACLLAFSVIAGACSKAPAGSVPAAPFVAQHGEDGIPWFEGSVEAAFAQAKLERRPVFLYWGAVWCPPCHALRTRLFSRPEFQARLAATIPVYLDGDTERAQIWGEKLGTQGYPTVIVFDADGREVTRILSLLPVEQYAEVLGGALDATRPVAELAATASEQGVDALVPADLNLLAFYSWYQDDKVGLDLPARRALFARLWSETAHELPVERARFLTLYLTSLADHDQETPAAELPAAVRTAAEDELADLLVTPELRATNLDLVLYFAPEVVRLVAPAPGRGRDELVATWTAAVRALEDDTTLTVDDRLTALAPQIELARIAAERVAGDVPTPLPPGLTQRIRERVGWAATAVHDEDELQAVMSTMTGLLQDAGLAEEARELLREKLGETTAPYYYQGWLASLEAEAGHKVRAVELYRQAWQGASEAHSGAAMTPFRWGSSYLRRAMQLAPTDTEAIAGDGARVLNDLLASPDAFAGGNWSRLAGLARALDDWRREDPAARGAVVDALSRQVQGACAGVAAAGDDEAATRCRSFLATES